MKTGLAATLIVLFALGAPCVVIAADEGEQAGSTTESTTATEGEKGADSIGSTHEEAGKDAEDKSDSSAKSSTMNVHRHRAGACPEGPPCPTGD